MHASKHSAPYNPSPMDPHAPDPAHPDPEPLRLERLNGLIQAQIARAGGWMPFDRFMSLALYAPGLGYYSAKPQVIATAGASSAQGDFITAPQLSPLFARALARQIRQALQAAQVTELWEFGPGRGTLAAQLLLELGDAIDAYHLVELSAQLRATQAEHLLHHAPEHIHKLHWHGALPDAIHGVLIGNEVLDAMPVQLISFNGRQWQERGVRLSDDAQAPAHSRYAWEDRASAPTLAPPLNADHFPPGSVTELHHTAAAWMHTVAQTLQRGALFLIDYGFPESEYYLPQRHQGTLVCHQRHRVDSNPLVDVGAKDITAHVNFTGVALSGQDAGLEVLGYTTQARFLMNCGLLDDLRGVDARAMSDAQKLVTEHEMGELFKVIGFAKGVSFDPLGFAEGDRSHTL